MATIIYISVILDFIAPSLLEITEPQLGLIVAVNLVLTVILWIAYLRSKGATIMGNYISIAGVTSSSINVESPYATALTNLDSSGQKDLALTLMELRDIVQAAKFAEIAQQKQAVEILESITEESQKPQPKRFSIAAMISTLAGLISSAAMISEKAPLLIEKLKEMFR